MRALLITVLLAGCSDRSANEIAIDVAAEANAQRGPCTPGDTWYGGQPVDCAVACASKPPIREMPPANAKLFCCIQATGVFCEKERWIEIEGVPGVCALVVDAQGERVDWQFCAENGWHLK